MTRITQYFAPILLAASLAGCMASPSETTTSPSETTSSSQAPASATSSSAASSVAVSSAAALGDIALGRAYFMQSTTQGDTAQLPEQQVPLAANKDALVRAFITGSGSTFSYRANAQFHYQLANGETGSLALNGPILLPRSVNELYLSDTYNGVLPAAIVQPGTRYYLSVNDSNGANETNSGNNRYPTSGWAELPVLDIPILDLVIVPIVTKNIAPKLDDAKLQELFSLTYQLYPLPNINIEIAPTITYEGESWSEMLQLVENIQIINGETDRYYLGIAGHPLTFDTMNITAGYAYIGRKTATSLPYADTIAHELGHNFGREHAPCGDAPGADSNYPYPNGEIGVYGLGRDGLRFNDSYYDIMSYCSPAWISDYTYEAVIKHLAADNPIAKQQKVATNATRPQLVINGRLTTDAQTRNQLIATDATIEFLWPATRYHYPQPANGAYQAIVRDSNGRIIAKQAFTPYQEDHGQQQLFTVAIDQPDEASRLQITFNDSVLTERMLSSTHSAQTLKAAQPITAERIDEHWVTVSNLTQLPAVIRDSDGHILSIARSSNAKVYTQSKHLIIGNQTVTISAP